MIEFENTATGERHVLFDSECCGQEAMQIETDEGVVFICEKCGKKWECDIEVSSYETDWTSSPLDEDDTLTMDDFREAIRRVQVGLGEEMMRGFVTGIAYPDPDDPDETVKIKDLISGGES